MKDLKMKPTIKFSHRYGKMPLVDKEAILLAVFETDFQDLCEEFIKYDTLYYLEDKNEYYKLPKKGKCLVLLFLSKNNDLLFTTIRSAFPTSKIDYYKQSIGKTFNIEINEKS